MGELAFVGLGLGDERGIPPAAQEVLRRCRRVFAEEYTATAPAGTLDRLAREIGHPIERLDRASVESEAPILEALDRDGSVALVVVGDPFAATTHVALRLAVERAGHSWTYHPNVSIVTAAAGLLGLSAYRFGRTVSLPFAVPGFAPTSPFEMLAANRAAGLHTLVLLDLAPTEGRYLTANEALDRLLAAPTAGVGAGTPVAVVARVGRPDAAAWFGAVGDLRRRAFGDPMHCLVVPASLHFEEEAALARYRVPADRSGAPAPTS